MLLAVFRMKWSGKLTTWAVRRSMTSPKLTQSQRLDPQGAFKVDACFSWSLGWQNVTATVGSRTRSSSRLSKCYLAFTASCIRISTQRMVENITIQVGESRGERH
jgi:hypothetical protein